MVVSGYPQLLSGDYLSTEELFEDQKEAYFSPEPSDTYNYADLTPVRRYPLSFPFYPFRTLCPRELVQSKMASSEFDVSAPLFPAHTQLNLVFKRRDTKDLLNLMLPFNLNSGLGATKGSLTQEERNDALTFNLETSSTNDAGVVTITKHRYRIKSVHARLRQCYLQVGPSPPPHPCLVNLGSLLSSFCRCFDCGTRASHRNDRWPTCTPRTDPCSRPSKKSRSISMT
jgi:hypothetical protein